MRVPLLLLLLASTSLCLGCRTVWMHPGATPEMFERDKAQCQREVENPPPDGTAHRSWKACLEANGWTSVADFWFGAAVREPLPKTKKGPRGRL